MKRIGNLYERLTDPAEALAALEAAARGKQDRPGVRVRMKNAREAAKELVDVIERGYEPSPPDVRAVYDDRRRKWREICSPRWWPDQAVHHALVRQLAPCVMRGMADGCMATVPGRGQHAAVRRVERWVRQDRRGTRYCLQMDVRHFYASIDRDRLKSRLRRLVKDERFLSVLDRVIDAPPGDGLPIGFYSSQWLANLYLQDLDHLASERLGARHYLRYMDDIIMLGPNKRALHSARREVQRHLEGLGLSLRADWQVYRVDSRPIDYLGYKIRREYTQVRGGTFLHLRRRLRKIGGKPRPSVREAREALALAEVAKRAGTAGIMRTCVYEQVSIRKMKGVIRDATSGERRAATRARGRQVR